MNNLYIPIDVQESHHDCQASDEYEGEPCEQQATWWCYPQGFLTTKIALCPQHKQEAQNQETYLEGLVIVWNGDEDDPTDKPSSPGHKEGS